MSVSINHTRARPSNRKAGYDRRVREMAPLLGLLQAKGFVSARDISTALRLTSLRSSKGKPYAESVVYGWLRRGKLLGLPLIVRSRSEAASASWPRPTGLD